MVDTASLQKYSLFAALEPGDIEKIRPFLGFVEYEEGATIIEEGRPNDTIYFTLEGQYEVWKSGVRLVDIGEGETFGEMELLDVMPAVASVRARTRGRVFSLSNRSVHAIFHMDSRIFAILIMNLARDLSRRLRRMDERAARPM